MSNYNLFSMKKILVLLCCCACHLMMSAAGLSVTNLRVDGQLCPLGIGQEQPIFTWTVEDGGLKGVKQQSFRVDVYSNPRCSKRVWTSRNQIGSNSWTLGPELDCDGTIYYWRVTAWDNKGRQCISKISSFIMGMKDLGWSDAKWLKGNRQDFERQDGATVLRKQFEVPGKKILKARLFASALGVFDVYMNGQRLGREDQDGKYVYDELKAGCVDYRTVVPYMTFDVTDIIKKGNNVVGAQLTNGWWSGDIAANIYNKPDLAFMAKIYIMFTDSTETAYVTDNTWQVNNCGPVRYGDLYHGETYDARLNYAWTKVGDSSSGWKPAELYQGKVDSISALYGPTVMIRPEYEQTVKKVTVWEGTKQTGTTYGEINIKSNPTLDGKKGFVLHKGETAIFDLGQNIVGWPEITVSGNSGAEITCHFGEALNDNGSEDHVNDGPAGSVYLKNLRTAKATLRYILAGDAKGETYHPSQTFFGFRYVSMTASEDVTIINLKGQVVGSDLYEYGTFECSDASVNQLYNNIRWSARGNFLSIPTDCPQRDERLGWTGDTQIFSRAACYTADMRTFYRKWMRDLRATQREDGAVPDVAPLGRYGSYGNAGWGDALVIVPWSVYSMYDDKDILDENYEAMKLYMTWLQSNIDDNFSFNGAGTDYGDWLAYEELDPRYVSVCYYAYVADLMARISIILGKEEEPDQYNALASAIREEFRKRYVIGHHLTLKTQTAYVLALHFNMLEDDIDYENAKKELREKIVSNGYKLTTGFIGTAYICPTLSEYDMNDLAYDLLLQRECPSWLYEVGAGATTVWERWDSFKTGEGFNKHEWNMNSQNHYANGVIAEWLYRDMLGMGTDYEDAGFHHIILAPKPDMRSESELPEGQKRIDWARGSIMTPYGLFSSEWRREKDGKIHYTFEIPFNCKATFYQPQPDGTTKELEVETGKWSF